jgi:hypothetical protein
MMSDLGLTIIIASVLVVLAMAFLGISWLITGKLSLRPGACGRAPTKDRDEHCGKDVTCGLCGKNEKKKNEDKDVPKK